MTLSEPDLSRQWRLARVEVVNWGTFDGFHGVDIARRGHLFTGPSGSGKSSLLDAITAALTPKRAITFNAAAQENTGRKGDRTWVSYVRGAWAKESDALEDRTIASYLRKGATWSGIMLRFERAGDDPVSLYRLFHLRGSSNAVGDLKELSFITRSSQDLLEFAPYVEGGVQAKKLKAEQKPLVVASGAKPGAYFTKLRRLLGIKNETALQLLHRTQAAKNFGTLDTLFRKFMLDEPKTFDMADKAIEEFRELREAHAHVVDLGHQKEALLLVQEAVREYESAQESVADLDALSSAVVPFADTLKLDSARKALSTVNGTCVRAENSLTKAQERVAAAEEQLTIADRRVLKLGGGDQRNLQARIADAEKVLEQVRGRRKSLFVRMRSRGLPLPETESDYVQLLATAQDTLAKPLPKAASHEQQSQLAQSRDRVTRLQRELESLNRRKSSIPSALLDVRDSLAAELGIPEGLMPFAGELMSVRAEHKAWSGAIERALAPISTALLVRDRDLDAVLDAVNRKHLGLNLTVDAVPQNVPAPAPTKDERSLVYRVDVSEGPFNEYLNHQISTRFDFACVDSPSQLDGVERGLTIQGLIKRSRRRYVKADRVPVDDRSRWVLGGDTEPKRRVLEAELEQARSLYQSRSEEVNQAADRRDKELAQRHMLSELLQKPWSDIDVVAAANQVSTLEQQWADLVKPMSELGQATEAQAQAKARVREERDRVDLVRRDLTLAQKEQSDLEDIIAELEAKDHAAVSEPIRLALDQRFRKHRRAIKYDQVHEIATSVQEQLRAQLNAAQKQVQQAWRASLSQLQPLETSG